MTNGEIAVNDLAKLDSKIRGLIDKEIHSTGVPVEFFYSPTTDSGLGLPQLTERQNITRVAQFGKLISSTDSKVKTLFKHFIDDEVSVRNISTSTGGGPFLNWDIDENGHLFQEHPDDGTACMVMKAFRAAKKLNLGIKTSNIGILIAGVGADSTNWRNATPKNITTVVNSIVKRRHFDRFRNDLTHSHTFQPTKVRESHVILRKPHMANNSLLNFTIAARTNTLATPANVAFHQGNPELSKCPVCQQTGTLMHVLNGCTANATLFTWRHDLIVNRIRDCLVRKHGQSAVHESRPFKLSMIGLPDEATLSDHNKNLRPDLTVIDSERNRVYLVEIGCPYGTVSHNSYTVEDRFVKKQHKYSSLMEEINNRADNWKCSLHIIIVSSLGIIHDKVPEELLRLGIGSPKQVSEMLENFSRDVLAASAHIFTGKPPSQFGLYNNDPPRGPADGTTTTITDPTDTTRAEELVEAASRINSSRTQNNGADTTNSNTTPNAQPQNANNNQRPAVANGSSPNPSHDNNAVNTTSTATPQNNTERQSANSEDPNNSTRETPNQQNNNTPRNTPQQQTNQNTSPIIGPQLPQNSTNGNNQPNNNTGPPINTTAATQENDFLL